MHLAPSSTSAIRSILMGLRASHARRSPRPDNCDACGAFVRRRSALTWYRHAWVCRACLCPEIPDCVEAHVSTGTSNFGEGVEVWGEYGWGWGIESD